MKGYKEKVKDIEFYTMESSSSINQCLNIDDHNWMPINFQSMLAHLVFSIGVEEKDS